MTDRRLAPEVKPQVATITANMALLVSTLKMGRDQWLAEAASRDAIGSFAVGDHYRRQAADTESVIRQLEGER